MWRIGDHPVRCTVCQHEQFTYREDLEGSRAMQYFGGPLFTPKVGVLQCDHCTYRMDFGDPGRIAQR